MKTRRPIFSGFLVFAVGALSMQCVCAEASSCHTPAATKSSSSCHQEPSSHTSKEASSSSCCGHCQGGESLAISVSQETFPSIRKDRASFDVLAANPSFETSPLLNAEIYHYPPGDPGMAGWIGHVYSPRAPPIASHF